jgi:hypothetical protein
VRRMRPSIMAALAIALVAGSGIGVAARDEPAGTPSLVTEEVEPGVERIISDGAGHDLDERHPTYRYDMDAIAIAPDGSVWLSTTYSHSDNRAHPETVGPLVWALGRPGTYGGGDVLFGIPPTSPTTYVFVRPDGTQTLATIEGVGSGDVAAFPDFEASGIHPELEGDHSILVARADGEHTCWNMGLGVMCQFPAGELTTYLPTTVINQIAAAADGTIWAVGGFDGGNGGLYHIMPE